jgi:predicted Zn-ribbon and HTH transcriptional regulator
METKICKDCGELFGVEIGETATICNDCINSQPQNPEFYGQEWEIDFGTLGSHCKWCGYLYKNCKCDDASRHF